MKREERNEVNYIMRSLKKVTLGYGTTLTIQTERSHEYKQTLHEYYTSLGYHPASVCVDTRKYDNKERIIYIYGQTYNLNGEKHTWTELYTETEKTQFETALQ